MSYEQDLDNNLIVRLLLQNASEEDITRLKVRMAEDTDFRKHFDQIQDTWNRIELEKELDDLKIKRDLDYVLASTERKSRSMIKSIFATNSWLFRAAALLVIGFGISWMVFQFPYTISNNEVSYNTIEIPRGSSSVVNLPDGSKITLNAQSKLRYPDNFGLDSRDVFLEGEAFFEVAKDKKRLFVVNTPELVVKVHGTSFNVKSYADDHTVETTLVEGSISLFKKTEAGEVIDKEIKMEPNQQLILYKAKKGIPEAEASNQGKQDLPKPMKPKLMLSKKIDTERYVSWKDGLLKIKSEPLDKLALTLERRYNVAVHFEEEQIKQIRFTGTIRNETIEQVMTAIKMASSIDYEIEERDIWIKSNVTKAEK